MKKERVVIVTGASTGIGRCIAYEYAKNGYRVVLADLSVEEGEKNVQQIKESGGEAVFVQTDVRKPEQIVHLMKQAIATYGQIDVLINNVGKMLRKSPYDITVEEWDDVLNTNLRSVFLFFFLSGRYMTQNSAGGSIVNISSTRSIMSEPYTELYAASKGGIVSITHALAASFSEDRMTVNASSPGWIETGDYTKLTPVDHDQHFSKRVGKPEDIARACLYLTAEDNDFVTGTNLVVDGGMTKKMIYEE